MTMKDTCQHFAKLQRTGVRSHPLTILRRFFFFYSVSTHKNSNIFFFQICRGLSNVMTGAQFLKAWLKSLVMAHFSHFAQQLSIFERYFYFDMRYYNFETSELRQKVKHYFLQKDNRTHNSLKQHLLCPLVELVLQYV